MSRLRQLKRTVAPPVHRVLDRAHRPVGERAFLTAFEQARAAGLVKVNIGSGRKPVDGWINTDVVRQGHIYLDGLQRWPIPEASVDFVYADNVIEHIPLPDTPAFLRNAFTAMKPGAVIRLATPDVEAVARQYLENGELARLGMERNAERGRPMKYPVQLIQNVFVGAQHYLGFCHDFHSLSTELAEAGFVNIIRSEAGLSDVPEMHGLEVRAHPAEIATQLVVEAVKP
ncbi:class I SAM-dependent methyltransferase [Jatrophihabitans sp. YIM 134969]